MRNISAIGALLLLAACASANPGQSTSKDICPPVKVYTPAEQTAVAGELDKVDQLIPGNHIRSFVDDYGTLRAMARACAAAK